MRQRLTFRNLSFVTAVLLFVHLDELGARGTTFGSYCGDAICQSSHCTPADYAYGLSPGDGCQEHAATCPVDCWDQCGDGICQTDIEANLDYEWDWCETDCGPVPTQWCGEGCLRQSDCSSDGSIVCTAQHCCLEVSPQITTEARTCGGTCSSNSECCGSDSCFGDTVTGHGYCAPAEVNWCLDSASCSSYVDCYNHYNCPYWGPGGCWQMYCDPGLGRCQFVQGAVCPDSQTVHQPS